MCVDIDCPHCLGVGARYGSDDAWFGLGVSLSQRILPNRRVPAKTKQLRRKCCWSRVTYRSSTVGECKPANPVRLIGLLGRTQQRIWYTLSSKNMSREAAGNTSCKTHPIGSIWECILFGTLRFLLEINGLPGSIN